MSARFARTAVCGFLLVAAVLVMRQRPVPRTEANEPKAKAPFGLTKVWAIHLDIPAKEFDALQPAFGGGFGPPPMPVPKKDEKKRDSERNLFGTEFPWVEADFTGDGTTVKKVGIRYAGDITYFVSGQGLKRPMKVAIDKFGKQDFHGLSAVNLHSMPLDPAKAREALAFSVFAAAGVPAPRTALAEVTIAVPGKHDKAYLGLFTVVEEVDAHFLAEKFGDGKGLLMRPFGVRGIDYLGDDWTRYAAAFRPQREATKDEQKRVIEFAKLVNQATDAEFAKQIGEFIDVDAFLRFLAAGAITCNLEGFPALGHNYHLYLDPKANKFRFIPGDLEFSLANFLLLGTPDQLMDLSVAKPYPGENKLPDRLLAIKDVKDKYLSLVKELTTKAVTKEQLLKDAEALEKATKDIREKEAKAVVARKEPPAGFGGPGGMGPQPPDIWTFAEKRFASIEAQLAGKNKGYAPQQFGFGAPPPGGGFGPPGGNNAQAITEQAFRNEVQVPTGFEATLFGVPPKVNYPVAIGCEPGGAVYVAVDEQGSLGRTAGGGKILRCVDKDGDGTVDDVTVFCKVDHPRGVCYRAGKVWVMHPPTLSVFEDTNGDGVADKSEILVTGLTTNQITDRGGDHTTNGVRMGIDGWLYIGVGDYGIKEAKGTDGRTIVQRGGGIVRVRPDGTDLEVFCTGLRNPFDIAIDPFMNVFVRDNTNDGAGWDTRVSLLQQSGVYGYTQLFANFTDEILPPLGVFGNGGATGGLFIQDSRWPENFRNTLLTSDWGRSEVYRHELKPNGPTFDLKQEVFVKLPRATGMDIDGSGRLYAASWRNGSAVGFEGPNIGFVTRITPKGFKAEPFPDLSQAKAGELLKHLAAPQSVTRLHAQGEILKRGKSIDVSKALVTLASDSKAALEARAAAVFTLKQLDGTDSHAALLKLADPGPVREFALRALTDRPRELAGLDAKAFVAALSDKSPRVRAQALISLGRLKDASTAKSILPLTARPDGSTMPTQKPLQNQPDADRVVPHLAVRALVAMNAINACLEALDGPNWQGALWAMRYFHDPKAVDGLVRKLATARDAGLRRGILSTLVRLYHREADYTGSWWGIRPDSTGPYYDRAKWAMSERIGGVITTAATDGGKDTVAFLKAELARHKVSLAGVTVGEVVKADDKPLTLPKADPKNPDQIGNLTAEVATRRTLAVKGDAKRGEPLFKSQSCASCHTTVDGQTPKGPHLVDIGKRYKPDELVESILKPSAKLAQGFETYRFDLHDGQTVQGFVVGERADATVVREANGVQRELKRSDVDKRTIQKLSSMPEGLASNLTPEQLADLLAYLQSLK